MFCNPEFGCDCEDVIGGLELQLKEAKEALLTPEDKIRATFGPKNSHTECGSTCTPECMRMTI